MNKELACIALQSGGYFYDACLRIGYLKEGESCVIEYQQFVRYMNKQELTKPLFNSPSYEVCIKVAKELNESYVEANYRLVNTEQEG